jgi:glycosyltransferase involved in cell wall biosynthesis
VIVGIDGRELQGRPTGVGRYVRNLLRQWSLLGSDRLLLYFNGPAPPDPVLARPGLESRPLGDAPTRGIVFAEKNIRAAALSDGVDVFFAPAYSCPLTLPKPRVTVVHDVSFFALPREFGLIDRSRRRTLTRASIAASKAIITVSEFSRREIARFFPEASGRVLAIPLGPDDDLPAGPPREAARQEIGAVGPLILSVGAILNRRRLPVLLAAFAQLRARHPTAILEVVGENRTEPRLDLQAEVRRLSLTDSVRLCGFLDEKALALRYAAADLCVVLSEYEGFGLPALEAMCRGLPVVTSDRPALSEIFGEAALLVSPGDPGQVAGALARILEHPALAQDLRERGRRLAERFSWAETARRTRDVLEQAAAP